MDKIQKEKIKNQESIIFVLQTICKIQKILRIEDIFKFSKI